ncbi:acyl-CoA N-acyltransferase [Hypoxylon cercidicola]|nr:acyl-CoA N-acyltransferase [Hypoxylon cercidicola]
MTLPFPHPSALLPPGFTLSRCTPADAPGMTSVYMNAFPAGSDFTYWWPRSVDAMRAWQADRIRSWLANPRVRAFKVVDQATSRLVAFAKWDLPTSLKGLDAGLVAYDEQGKAVEQSPKEGEAQGVATRDLGAPEGANVEMFQDLFVGITRMREKWQVDGKLLLHIIAADPAYHGRGIATAVIKCVLDVADAEGVSTYLEALPLAVPLYRRLGFVEVDKMEFDLARAGMEGTAVLTIMVREPGMVAA